MRYKRIITQNEHVGPHELIDGRDQARGLDTTSALRILDAIQAGVVVVTPEGMILHANAEAASILQRTVADLEGLPVDIPLAPLDELLDSRADGDETWSLLLPSGAEIMLGFRIARIDRTSRFLRGLFAIVFSDKTSQIRLQRERDRFLQLATMSHVMPALLHELRNPLAAITTTIEVLLDEVTGGEVRACLHAVLEEIRRMRLSLDGIGAAGRTLASHRRSAIDDALREAALVLKGRTERAEVGFACRVDDMPPLPLDPAVVRAVTFNLVMNAMDACQPGDLISLSAHLTQGPRDAILEICVEDNGHGMTEEELDRCTELFFTSKSHGTGIGLALCTRAIEEARGEMTIHSEPGVGTRIRVQIPIPLT